MFRVLDILPVKWATGDFPDECLFLFDTQIMFWKTGQAPTTQIFLDTSGGDHR